MESTDDQVQDGTAAEQIETIAQSLAEQPGRAIELAMQAGGERAVQALFDAVLDQGHRKLLVDALKSPALTDAARQQLHNFLYGGLRQLAALLLQRLV